MCISELSIDNLNSLGNYKYSTTNKSIVYNYFISPSLDFCIKFFPLWIAPNLLTILSLVMNVFSLVITILDAGNDFTQELSISTCIVQLVCHFLYIVLDNLDGKQARRTGSSSPYGMLLDHGCDIFTNIIVAYNMSHLLMTGMEGPFSVMFFISLYMGFFTITYEEYIIGNLNLGYFNGADEGNVIVCILTLIACIFGNDVYELDLWFLTFGQLVVLVTLLGSAQCVVMTLINIYLRFGCKKLALSFVDWICFYNVIVFPVLITFLKADFFVRNFSLVMLAISLLYARQTLDLQIKIICKQKLKFGFVVILVNIALIASFFVINEKALLTIFAMSSIALGTEITMITVIRSMEILPYLRLRLCCITVNNMTAM